MEAHGEHESSVQVELRGLSIYTHHGVTDAEQEIGQRLVIDVSFDVPDCDAVLTDRLEDTIDYAEVADIVALAATERSYRTLERLVERDRRAADGALRLRLGPRARREARAADPARDRGGRGRGRRASASSPTSTRRGRARGTRREPGLPRARLERRRPARPPARRGRAARASTGCEVTAVSSVYETEPVGEILDQPDFLNAAVADRDRARPGGAARPRARRSRSSGARIFGRPAPRRRARSTSTCCCSTTSSSRPSG